jgi:integrase
MNTQHRYQYGSLTRRKRIRTEDVWQFRYYETDPEGQRHRRSKIVGMLSQYPTATDALRILERVRLRLNLQNRLGPPVTLDALVDDYVEKELPQLRYGTQQAHLSSLHRWIRPRWGEYLVYEIKPVEVEQWLRSLPLAAKSKVNLRSLLHLVFQHGRRWEITDANPIDLVRQRGGRRSIPRVLNVHDIRSVLAELTEPYRTMVLVAACLGLRASEIIGLQWGDFNWGDGTLLVKRSVVHGRVGDTKTEASRLPLPVDPSLADVIRAHWQRSLHPRTSRLGICEPRGEAALAGEHFATAHQTGSGAGRRGQDWLAHISTFLLEPVTSSKCRHQSAARVAAALDHPEHDECLYASHVGGQACRQQCDSSERIT